MSTASDPKEFDFKVNYNNLQILNNDEQVTVISNINTNNSIECVGVSVDVGIEGQMQQSCDIRENCANDKPILETAKQVNETVIFNSCLIKTNNNTNHISMYNNNYNNNKVMNVAAISETPTVKSPAGDNRVAFELVTTSTQLQQQQQQRQYMQEGSQSVRTTETILMPAAMDNCFHDTTTATTISSLEPLALEQPHTVLSAADGASDSSPPPSQSYDDALLQPLSERWSPLGANYDDPISSHSEMLSPGSDLELLNSAALMLGKQNVGVGASASTDEDDRDDVDGSTNDNATELERLRNIEEEQELLTTSLLALTSHFAHVQLRVRQIVEAPTHERDQLLKDLEDFAFQGIPEPAVITTAPRRGESASIQQSNASQTQCEIIAQLKSQLIELEQMAYESGAPVLPQHMLLEKQKIIIDELKHKLNLKVDEHNMHELSSEELKSQVDNAIGEFVGPLKMKEQLVAQLKTQITDLERFIAYLQCDADDSKQKMQLLGSNGNEKIYEAYNSYAAKSKRGSTAAAKEAARVAEARTLSTLANDNGANSNNIDDVSSCATAAATTAGMRESLNSKAHGLLDKASLLMQMFASMHFNSKHQQQQHFQKNTLKKTSKGNHWGDLRAQLEVDIQEVAALAATLSCDRQKLANIKRALKQKKQQQVHAVAGGGSAAATTSSGVTSSMHCRVLTTIPPSRRCAPYVAATAPTRIKEPFSSDSEEDTYDWDVASVASTRRIVHMRGDSIATISKELTTVVRKNFAKTLQKLIQHGLRVETESSTSSLVVPFMRCLQPKPVLAGNRDVSFLATPHTHVADVADYDETRSSSSSSIFGYGRPMHAWELVLEYYYLKNGDEYNNTPARKLSQSFNLDIIDSQAVTAKQSLLSAVGMIVAMHRPYKRSYNSHFKAFICAGLNAHLLVEWLNLILSCNELIDTYYAPNSYVARTGFRDSLRSIDSLTKYDFDLPVDLAIRHFRNI